MTHPRDSDSLWPLIVFPFLAGLAVDGDLQSGAIAVFVAWGLGVVFFGFIAAGVWIQGMIQDAWYRRAKRRT